MALPAISPIPDGEVPGRVWSSCTHHDPEVAADAWRRVFAFSDEYLRNRSTT
jgi:hypothetical protein